MLTRASIVNSIWPTAHSIGWLVAVFTCMTLTLTQLLPNQADGVSRPLVRLSSDIFGTCNICTFGYTQLGTPACFIVHCG